MKVKAPGVVSCAITVTAAAESALLPVSGSISNAALMPLAVWATVVGQGLQAGVGDADLVAASVEGGGRVAVADQVVALRAE